jgi:protein phosphatase
LPDVDPDVYKVSIAKNDSFLLCSDGLYTLVPNDDIVEILSKFPVGDSGSKLIELANRRGGIDNITVVILTFEEPKNLFETTTAIKTKSLSELSTDKKIILLWLSIVTASLILAAAFYYLTQQL